MSALADVLPSFDQPWTEVGRVYRRVCFLRSEGMVREALRVEETELAAAVARAREPSASDSEADAVLAALRAREEERVRDAIAFAEVLVPLLEHRLSLGASARAAGPAPVSRAARAAAPAQTRGIADFIDDMLAQERLGAR